MRICGVTSPCHPRTSSPRASVVAAFVTVTVITSTQATNDRKTLNVLHMVADDLRPELGLYGSTNAVTPNLDALAAKSAVFVNAFCQQPVCSPSRNSFMTALRPDSTGAWNFINYFRQKHPKATSFPQFFKEQPGYLALGSGKLYHTSNPPDHDEPLSWSPEANGSQTYFEPAWQKCPLPASTFCVSDTLPEEEDAATAAACVGHVRRASTEGKGFYVGCGFHRPHAPYIATSAAWASHDNRPTTLPVHRTMPSGVPALAQIVDFHIGVENGTSYEWAPGDEPAPVDVTLAVRKHYFAAITFMDSLVGQVVGELDKLGLASSTVVVFHADHGYFQGESGEWEKKMLFENTARVPLIIHDPLNPTHWRVAALAELVDVYPTAVALAGFAVPAGLDGTSLVPLIRGGGGAPTKQYAFTQYPRCVKNATSVPHSVCLETPEADFDFMGYSVRSSSWRYTEWRVWVGARLRADWTSAPVATELYNHTGHDADSPLAFDHPQDNRAADPSLAPVRAELAAALRAQFDAGAHHHDEGAD